MSIDWLTIRLHIEEKLVGNRLRIEEKLIGNRLRIEEKLTGTLEDQLVENIQVSHRELICSKEERA